MPYNGGACIYYICVLCIHSADSVIYHRGYVVSNFATDGFALLRGDRIYSNNAPPARAASRKAVVAEEKEVAEKEDGGEEGGASEDGEGSRKKARAEKTGGSDEYADKGSIHYQFIQ